MYDTPMTNKCFVDSIFVGDMNLSHFHSVAVTHKNFSIKDLGKLHIDGKYLRTHLASVKQKLHLKELIYLSTCNRVEVLFTTEKTVDKPFLTSLFSLLN